MNRIHYFSYRIIATNFIRSSNSSLRQLKLHFDVLLKLPVVCTYNLQKCELISELWDFTCAGNSDSLWTRIFFIVILFQENIKQKLMTLEIKSDFYLDSYFSYYLKHIRISHQKIFLTISANKSFSTHFSCFNLKKLFIKFFKIFENRITGRTSCFSSI